MTAKLLVMGGGRMGQALLGGLIDARWARPDELCVVEAVAATREQLATSLPGVRVIDRPEPATDVLLAVKPQDVDAAARALADAGTTRVLSIVAGVTTVRLEGHFGPIPVVRCMPNTAALVGEAMAAVAPGARADDTDLAWAEAVLSAVGQVVRVAEADLDAVTGLSGSGPAYVFALVEALAAAGVVEGLAPDLAARLARQTVVGAGRLLAVSDESPATLREAVTSKGGTTEAGLVALADHDFAGTVAAGVAAATLRSQELAD